MNFEGKRHRLAALPHLLGEVAFLDLGRALLVLLLVDRLQVRDHLRKGRRQLPHNLADLGLIELALLTCALVAAECRLAEWPKRIRLVLPEESWNGF